MTSLVFDAVRPDALADFVRRIDPTTLGLTLSQFLPNRAPKLTNKYKFNYRAQVRPMAAHFRAFDARGPKIVRPGYETVEFEIPPMSIETDLSEEDRIRIAQLQADGTLSADLEESIFDDAAALARGILDRLEFARGELLSTGVITFLHDYGYTDDVELDFQVPVGNFVNAAHDWAVPAASTPWTDWIDAVEDFKSINNGRAPDWTIMSTLQQTQLRLSAESITILTGNNVLNARALVRPSDVEDIRQTNSLPPIFTYDTSVNLNGSTTKCIAPDKLIMGVSGPDFGETFHGVTAQALAAAGNTVATGIDTSTAPGMYVHAFDDEATTRSTMIANAIALPALKDPQLLYVVST